MLKLTKHILIASFLTFFSFFFFLFHRHFSSEVNKTQCSLPLSYLTAILALSTFVKSVFDATMASSAAVTFAAECKQQGNH
ncbi:uncharacterized protein MONOS_17802 [Monocercomonoides exilis]|uniref:uncharacterized protein n=1 Tax=Monocercomonoides exilis TaxID=2049356 RepID=UPI00355A35F2|nr:hypothetical protein MONOS_17802 [Monocercomonoides exilis]